MKQNKLFISLAAIAAALTFASCSSDELEKMSQPEKARTISFTSTISNANTRATSDPQSSTSLKTGQNVGIFGVSSEETTTMTNFTNNKYVTGESNAINLAEGSSAMTWPTASDATASIYAYIPWQEGYTVDGSNSFSVADDQSTEANYLASDLLLAKAPNQSQNTTVTLPFSHLMSQIRVIISKADGSNINLENATVSITNVDKTVVFTPNADTPLGATSGNGNITAATIASDLTAGSGTATAYALIVPQTLAAGTAFIQIVAKDTENNSKTLIGKLGEAATFASGTPYSLTISVGTITDPVTEVAVSLGAASLIAWDTVVPIGLTAYGVGDYVLKDGTFIKAADYSANSSNVAAIIFSTTVSSTDKAAGYNAYAMGLTRRTARTFPNLDDYKTQVLTSAVTGYYAGYSDLDGRTKTAQMLAHEFYTTGLDDTGRSTFVANMSGYTPAFTDAAKNETTGTVSDWFLPSFGQMRQILSEFGGVTFVVSGEEDPSETNTGHTINGTALNSWGSNSPFYTSDNNALTTLVTNLNSHVSGMFAEGNICFATSTENGGSGHVNKFWFIGTENTNMTYWMGKGMQRGNTVSGGNGYNTIPVVAVKLPAVAE